MNEPDYSQFNALIFDSGVGGLSIAEQIQQALPSLALTYVGDTGFFPYGVKDADILSDRISLLITRLYDALKPDLVVIACNTASTLVLDRLRAQLSIPIVGVVPAIKPAAKASNNKRIGLLATQATVSRQYTRDLVTQYASDCQVIYIGSPRLVEIAELKLNGQTLTKTIMQELKDIMHPFVDCQTAEPIDTIILGCTHFPLIKSELQASIPEFKGKWVDSGKAIASRVAFLLATATPSTKIPRRTFNKEMTAEKTPNTAALKKEPHRFNKAYWSQNQGFNSGFEQAMNIRGFECLHLSSIIDCDIPHSIISKHDISSI